MKVSHLHSNLNASRRTHDLRHGAASLAHEAGADLKTLQDLLGPRVTQVRWCVLQ